MKRKSKDKPTVQPDAKAKQPDVQELQAQVEALQREKEQLFEKLQRLGADYANFQKRNARQVAEAVAYEKEAIIRSLLPVLDNFERTLQNADSADSKDVVLEGVGIIYKQMLDILRGHGVEQISSLGQKFDPAVQEAMMRRADPDREDEVILEEFQKAYKLNGRVIRPGKVVVNKLPGDEQSQQQPAQDDRTGGEDEARHREEQSHQG